MASVWELGRGSNWWDSKIPPVLALCFSSALVYRVPAGATVRCVAIIVGVGICAGAYGHIVNDVFDLEADRQAGKRNTMSQLAPWQRFALCALTVALGFAPAVYVPFSTVTLALLAIEYALPTIYAAPPLRLKERGLLGVVCDAMGAHGVPALYTVSVMAHERAPGVPLAPWTITVLPAAAFCWALCLGLKGIVLHEFQDREADIRAGVSTFATGGTLRGVRSAITRVYLVELGAFTALLLLLATTLPIVLFAAVVYLGAVYVKVMRAPAFFARTDDDASAIRWWQFSHPFYEWYFPLAAALQVAWRFPVLLFLPLLQAMIFRADLRWRRHELSELGDQLWVWINRS